MTNISIFHYHHKIILYKIKVINSCHLFQLFHNFLIIFPAPKETLSHNVFPCLTDYSFFSFSLFLFHTLSFLLSFSVFFFIFFVVQKYKLFLSIIFIFWSWIKINITLYKQIMKKNCIFHFINNNFFLLIKLNKK